MSIALIIIFWPIKEEEIEKKEERIRFECGFMNIGARKTNFSTNFVIVVLMFLIFDIEVSILVTITISRTTNPYKSTIRIAFLTVVTILLIKE